jgi:cell division protein ZapE
LADPAPTGQRRDSAADPVTERLKTLTAEGTLTVDSQQARAAQVLDRIAAGLSASPRGLFGLGKPKSVTGAYLVGAVGRGKTMLMDLFFETVEIDAKVRAHFHEFMDDVHAAITAFRQSSRGRGGNADPVAAAVEAVLGDTRLLCLDEFQVQDITNAMLLGRLFGKLFDRGVTIVATSNTPPDDLY